MSDAPRVLIPLAEGVEEIEAVTLIDVLRRGGIEVVVAGLADGPIVASRGVRLLADVALDDVLEQVFDAVVLPGGLGGSQRLATDPRIAGLLERCVARDALVGAICAAPMVLSQAGLLADRTATAHPSVMDTLSAAATSEERVVVDRGVATSRGAGTAMEFALRLVRDLVGAETEAAVAAAMVV